MLAIIGFATAIITFGFIIPLIHIKGLFILWNIARYHKKWRTEIGNFNGFSEL